MGKMNVRNAEIEALLKAMGENIDNALPKGWGFTLMLYDYDRGEMGSMFYISKADREDMIKALKEFIEKLESYQC